MSIAEQIAPRVKPLGRVKDDSDLGDLVSMNRMRLADERDPA
ncbi:MAG: hypothetical protein P8J59_05560 [Phycisphaerales bacterium]|nr:hypothetical protein [Phycisphaerales bacterium]